MLSFREEVIEEINNAVQLVFDPTKYPVGSGKNIGLWMKCFYQVTEELETKWAEEGKRWLVEEIRKQVAYARKWMPGPSD